MTSFFSLFHWTMRETLRDRILWAYGVFALLLVVALFAVGHVPWGETHIIVGQLGYSAIALVSQILAALLVAFQLGRDVERRVHYMILGRDIKRSSYLLGRVFGLWATASIMVIVLVTILVILNGWQTATYRGPMWSLFGAIPLIVLQIGMVLALATLLYQATTSTTLAMILALLCLAVGRSIASVQQVLSSFGDVPRFLGQAGAYIFPNLELLAFNQSIIQERWPEPSQVMSSGVYAIAYMVTLLAMAVLILNRKEL